MASETIVAVAHITTTDKKKEHEQFLSEKQSANLLAASNETPLVMVHNASLTMVSVAASPNAEGIKTQAAFDASAFMDEQLAEVKREYDERERTRIEMEIQEKKNMFQFSALELGDIEQPGLLKLYGAAKKKMFAHREKFGVSEEMCYVVLHNLRKYAKLSFALVESIQPVLCFFFVYFVNSILYVSVKSEWLQNALWVTYLLSVLCATTMINFIPDYTVLYHQFKHMVMFALEYNKTVKDVSEELKPSSDPDPALPPTEAFNSASDLLIAELAAVKTTSIITDNTTLKALSTMDAAAVPTPATNSAIKNNVTVIPVNDKNTVDTYIDTVLVFVCNTIAYTQLMLEPALKNVRQSQCVANATPVFVALVAQCGIILKTIALRPRVNVIGRKILTMFVFAAINLLLASMGCFTTSILIGALCMNYLTYVYMPTRIMQDMLVATTSSVILIIFPSTLAYGNAAVVTYYCTAFACYFTAQSKDHLRNDAAHASCNIDAFSFGKHMVFLAVTASTLYIGARNGVIYLHLDKTSTLENSAQFFFVLSWFLYTESHYLVLDRVNTIIMSSYIPITLQQTYFVNVILLLLASWFGGLSHYIVVTWGQFICAYLVCYCYAPVRCIAGMGAMFNFKEMLAIAELEKASPKQWVHLNVDPSVGMGIPNIKGLLGDRG
jgi:hypothetical protein